MLSETQGRLSARRSAKQGRPWATSRTTNRAVLCQSVASTIPAATVQTECWPGVSQHSWKWKGHSIRYQRSTAPAQKGKPALVLIHGFGGSADHWRKNTGVLGALGFDVYAIDLLGYGYSDKPDPSLAAPNTIYNFGNWGQQVADFVEEVVAQPTHLICNSVGGLTGLEAAIARPKLVMGVQLMNISLRMLHQTRVNPMMLPLLQSFQRLLRETPLGVAFFNSVAKKETVKNILQQAYCNKAAVTDELVECVLLPGLQKGAAPVFLDFISYSSGPLPEDLITACPVPVSIIWGERDPWEDVVLARTLFSKLPGVTEFIVLPNVGHCPMDEAPLLVNPLIEAFASRPSLA